MAEYIWLVPLFPLIGVVINGLLGIRFPKKVIGPIACLAILGSFLVSLAIFLETLPLPESARLIEKTFFPWIVAGEFTVHVGFLIDPLSLVMMLTVSGVSFIIHIYSIGYMHGDPGYRRYFVYLNLFVFFMLTLVSASSFLLMFVGWEGVGLCSYLLIGFWYERKAPADAGKKAFIVNRIGDYGFLLAMLLIFTTFGTLDFLPIFKEAPLRFESGSFTITVMTLLLFVGACGKSAQIPLYVWLPDAMEGPTPVSALIHAATMVTAGVYMVARCSPLYNLAPFSLEVVAVIGACTAFYAATIGLLQNDIKRVLAYSTISQLGYMFLGCGVGAYTAGIFHLMTHAFFKALLFLGAGSVMHAMAGELDMRKMGGLRDKLPKTHVTFLIATLAIAGIFPFAGFFSKDEILWEALQKNTILCAIGAISALLTAFYMFRAVFLTFYGEPRIDPHIHPHESPSVMTTPLIILAILSVIGGWVGLPLIKGGNRIKEFLAPVLIHGEEVVSHNAGSEITMMLVSMGIAVIGIIIAYNFYLKNPKLPNQLAERFKGLYTLIYNKYFIDELYNNLFVQPMKEGSNLLWLSFDDKVIDGMVNGAGNIVRSASGTIRRIQTGSLQNYALYILFGVVVIILYLLR
jgi:NADH-quinone oxidoreductase subunit L